MLLYNYKMNIFTDVFRNDSDEMIRGKVIFQSVGGVGKNFEGACEVRKKESG